MSFFGGIWKGIKKAGSFIGKVVNIATDPMGSISNLIGAASANNSGQQTAYSPVGVVAPPVKPFDLNDYVKLPQITVAAEKSQINPLLIGLAAVAAILLFKK